MVLSLFHLFLICLRNYDIILEDPYEDVSALQSHLYVILWIADTSDPGHFGTSLMGPNCQDRSALVPKCPKNSSDLRSAELSCPSSAINSRRLLPCRRLAMQSSHIYIARASTVPQPLHRAFRMSAASYRTHLILSQCVCLSVCLSHAGIASKRSITQTKPHDSPGALVFDAKDLGEILSFSHQVAGGALSQQRSVVVPKCPRTRAEMSWCQSVLGPKCPVTNLVE